PVTSATRPFRSKATERSLRSPVRDCSCRRRGRRRRRHGFSSGVVAGSRGTRGRAPRARRCRSRASRPSSSHPGEATVWPAFIHHRQPYIYGLFTPGQGVKVAEHHTGEPTDPDHRSFDVDPAGRERVVRYVEDWFPGLVSEPASAETCLYTTTPTQDFVV